MTGKWVSNVSYMRHTSKHKATSQCVCACVSSRRAALWSGIWWCVTHTSKSEQRQMLITHYMSAHTHTHVYRKPIIITLTDRLKHCTVQIFWVNQTLTVCIHSHVRWALFLQHVSTTAHKKWAMHQRIRAFSFLWI